MTLERIALAFLATGLIGAAPAAPDAPVRLWRLDCGTIAANDLDRFSDTRAYVGQSKRLVASCYLIRHGETWMLWDTGLPASLKDKPADPISNSLAATLPEQLARIGVKPSQIAIVGISHYHGDHIGQAAFFPNATLMIGGQDMAVMKERWPGDDAKPLAPWIDGGGKVDAVEGDKDVFGDGTVTMLSMPGHTPGHHALLVKLANKGPVMLTGDTAHFQQNYDTNGVPSFNKDRADTLASLDRFKRMAANVKAIVVIQHEPADVAKLPAFPQAAD